MKKNLKVYTGLGLLILMIFVIEVLVGISSKYLKRR